MSNLEKEIADAQAKLERLKRKQREVEAKERARFAEALVVLIDEIEGANEVTVRELVDRARAMLDEQDAKRREAAKRAAARRAVAAQSVKNVDETVQRDELNETFENQAVWSGYRVAS